MLDSLEPIKAPTLKDVFVTRLENLIISGEIGIGEKLPSERDLAERLNVSRPVVHEGLVELAARGLVTLRPRSVAVVNDYRKKGSISLLSSLINYQQGKLEPKLFGSLLDMRLHLETEFAHLAAQKRTEKQLAEMKKHLKKESSIVKNGADHCYVTDVDFDFHLLIAVATDNIIYPMILNSFKQVYTNLSGQFFQESSVVKQVFSFHRDMVEAIEKKNAPGASKIMKAMLEHGEQHLKSLLKK